MILNTYEKVVPTYDKEKLEKYWGIATGLKDDDIENISAFTSSIWQVHPFAEGNTRTVALFMQMYLNSKGFDVNNDLFKENSLFFRNALVRSNYQNFKAKVYTTNEFFNSFFENLLLEKNIELSNEKLDVSTQIKKSRKLSQ